MCGVVQTVAELVLMDVYVAMCVVCGNDGLAHGDLLRTVTICVLVVCMSQVVVSVGIFVVALMFDTVEHVVFSVIVIRVGLHICCLSELDMVFDSAL